MTYLVTGSTGLLGAALVRTLAASGCMEGGHAADIIAGIVRGDSR